MITQVIAPDGTNTFLDVDNFVHTYKALAVRVTTQSEIEVLVSDNEGLVWQDVTEVAMFEGQEH